MAKQNKAGYDSYVSDAFDNPPIGPVGVHRGPRSMWVRAIPYLTVLVVAILAGLLVWGVSSGELGKLASSWNGSSQTASDSTTNGQSKKKDASKNDDASESDASTSDGSATSGDGTNADGSDATSDGSQQSDDQSAQQSDDQSQDDQSQTQPNKATQIRVVNAAGITGYAAQQAGILENAGYTSVEAANPSGGTLPSATVVWYQNETDAATAQDVASTLGIDAASVQQVSGLSVPVVVVLMN